jgi:hypothetical protein
MDEISTINTIKIILTTKITRNLIRRNLNVKSFFISLLLPISILILPSQALKPLDHLNI